MKLLKKGAKEFKKFAMQGDIVNLAIGVIIGTAFKDVVNSLVNDIIMPPLGYVTGRVDFSDLYISLSRRHYDSLIEATNAGAPVIKYGLFINQIVNFLLIALVIFIFVYKARNVIAADEAKPKTSSRTCPYCRSQISRKATKCPFCTSKVEPKVVVKSDETL